MGRLDRLVESRIDRPYTLALALVLPIPGTLALIYGDAVSAALGNIAADTVSRFMGAALLAGAVLTLIGLARNKHVYEFTGLSILAIGLAVYGLGVLLGLGLQGAVAGPIALAVSLGTVLRLRSLSAKARVISSEP